MKKRIKKPRNIPLWVWKWIVPRSKNQAWCCYDAKYLYLRTAGKKWKIYKVPIEV